MLDIRQKLLVKSLWALKQGMLKNEQMTAFKSVKYLMFHYWSNSQAYLLTKGPILVSKDNVPLEYLIRIEKDAVKYLLLDYYPRRLRVLTKTERSIK